MLSQFAGRLRQNPDWVVAALALLAVALPPLLLGPWLPFVDLTAYVGLHNYPPPASYGPLHYYVFQFTYIGHYALSRLMHDLGISVGPQIVLVYLLEAVALLGVMVFSLRRLVESPWLRAVGTAAGCLAFWDGLFLWGGPLAFELAAVCVAVAIFLTLREAHEPEKRAGAAVAVLMLTAMVCHPFALPFALLVVALRGVMLPGTRWGSAALAAALAGFAVVIARDGAPGERVTFAQLSGLLDFTPGGIAERMKALFLRDAWCAQKLFGFVPAALRGYFGLMSVVHLAGFVCAPLLVVFARDHRALRMLGVLVSAVAVLYFSASEAAGNPVPEWPQRILAVHSPFTFLAGFAGPIFLLARLRARRRLALPAPAALRWVAPPVLLAWAVAAQVPILALSESVRRNHESLRERLVQSGIRDAYVVFSDIEDIQPFCLRVLPFLLFSDPEIVGRNLICATEWHHQARHPTRLTEAAFDLGRPRYLARFSMAGGRVQLELERRKPASFPVPDHPQQPGYMSRESQAKAQFELGMKLANQGMLRDAAEHLHAALRLRPEVPDFHNNLAVVLSGLGRPEEALGHIEVAVRLAPGAEDSNINLAAILLARGDRAGAARQIEEFLRLRPDSARAQEWARQSGLRP